MDARDQRLAELARQNAELRAQLAVALARIAELEEKLRQASSNSSKPPSSDMPWNKRHPKKKPTGRTPGAQPGRERTPRPLVPAEQVTERVVCTPTACDGCGGAVRGRDPAPRRIQTFELPKVVPVVTEYELHTLPCLRCGRRTCARPPAGADIAVFGPRVEATVAVLAGVYRLSKRSIADVLAGLFGLPLSVGAVVGLQMAASAALAPAHEEACAQVARERVKNADETGWRQGRARAWLWTVVTASVTMFVVAARRNAAVAQQLLGRALGVLGTDRHGAYTWWPTGDRQLCWAHLVRDLRAMQERGGEAAAIATELLAQKDRLFGWWHRVRDGTLQRSTFRVYARGVQRRVEALLERGQARSMGPPKSRKVLVRLWNLRAALFTFVRVEGVEPTNNVAERAVRHAVLWRRTSYGTKSAAGSRFVERMLTVHASCRQQGRSVVAFVEAACRAARAGTASPSLLAHDAEPAASLAEAA